VRVCVCTCMRACFYESAYVSLCHNFWSRIFVLNLSEPALAYVRMCIRERENEKKRERESVRVCACKCERVCARAHACERVLGYVFVRVCVQVRHELYVYKRVMNCMCVCACGLCFTKQKGTEREIIQGERECVC